MNLIKGSGASFKLTRVDAFASGAAQGNPAAVCLLERPAPADWMRRVAAKMDLSETAFLWPKKGNWSLRWFTPTIEVDLCGHATLASAHVLWASGAARKDRAIRFITKSGVLTARRRGARIELDFPRLAQAAHPAPGLTKALGVRPTYTGAGSFGWLAVLGSEREVRALKPSMARLRALPAPAVIVTARASTTGYDLVSRVFAPKEGIPEDPVTGSAHCLLGPYWAERLGKKRLKAFQCSARGGEMIVEAGARRVRLIGRAATVPGDSLIQ